MSCLPATCEIIGYVLLAPYFLGVTRAEAAVMGAVLAAVSPAVVVPRMVQLMESGRGTDKSIPQMILAGASCDDIFVIVLFTTFLHTAQGGSANAADFLSIPASIVSALCWGKFCRWLLSQVFSRRHALSDLDTATYGRSSCWGPLSSSRRAGSRVSCPCQTLRVVSMAPFTWRPPSVAPASEKSGKPAWRWRSFYSVPV